jgi:glucose-6-phosphate 1-epimerase
MADQPPGHAQPGASSHDAASLLAASCERIDFRGQPAWHLTLAQGDSIVVCSHGAQVVSWVARGRERLFLSETARFDGQSAIRGGVPVCFPQFNQRGNLAKHGFARNLAWESDGQITVADGRTVLSLSLSDTPDTRQWWPWQFRAVLTLSMVPGDLQVSLEVTNLGGLDHPAAALSFTGALHTYLAVDDVGGVTLSGLGGQAEWDAVTDVHGPAAAHQTFNGEFDRVYAAASTPLLLQDGSHRLRISQSTSFADTVVWNPGAALCARLADMPENGYQHMLCVEAAAVNAAVTVPAGATWCGWQRLEVA